MLIYIQRNGSENWGRIKPTPTSNINTLTDREIIDLGNGRSLEAIWTRSCKASLHILRCMRSKTLFMGDTLNQFILMVIYVQPNLPPPDFNKEILFKTLDDLKKLELNI